MNNKIMLLLAFIMISCKETTSPHLNEDASIGSSHEIISCYPNKECFISNKDKECICEVDECSILDCCSESHFKNECLYEDNLVCKCMPESCCSLENLKNKCNCVHE